MHASTVTQQMYGVEAAKRDLAHVKKFPGRSIKVHACNQNVRVIKNSGPYNSMMDRLKEVEEDIGVLKKYALGPFSLPRPHILFGLL